MSDIKDSLGNVLRKGSLCFWTDARAVVRILDVQMNGGKRPVGELTVELKVPFEIKQPETFLPNLVAVIDPGQQAIIEEMVSSGSEAKSHAQ